MRIGICDDIKKERIHIEEVLKNSKVFNKYDDTITLYSPEEVMMDLEEKVFCCDIMIMDIEFEHEEWNGITLAAQINELTPSCQIIYLTHILEFAPEIYETDHCYFVLKKNMDIMLPNAMIKARRLFDKMLVQSAVEITSDGHTIYILQKDIIYVSRQERKIIVHTTHMEYECYMSLSAFLKMVGDDFVRCHGGYIVNLSFITYLGTDYIMVGEQTKIPIGTTYCNRVKQKYLLHWSWRV